jgi:cellular nucleic acid-binding protein
MEEHPQDPQRMDKGKGPKCYNCSQFGHISQDCKSKSFCYNCRMEGHVSRECSNPMVCLNCKGAGHRSRDCKEPRKTGDQKNTGIKRCSNCNKFGHLAKDCRSATRYVPPAQRSEKSAQWTCAICRNPGHSSAQCAMNRNKPAPVRLVEAGTSEAVERPQSESQESAETAQLFQ